ncbi:hypothetical protein GUITHDRAFT_146070 [Guillardia theta CCMP2712]|uniref:Uncharacterized protein n=2 Tax=Guillardia theta TaxID=55529 RepID=L1IJC2_GUITC|nr:hypothetical protein GUITHDRAFT_146070 [Guillardia theta CCMP2712]EKX36029.1 hypothetical protein GUITHDRAFT_146070 [Guillardia theta CCMP2712]|eukprot:XP_005823009.1 hypothetical protein GUITHDRAFT_146070 [Guillardia theta CCMP2712]
MRNTGRLVEVLLLLCSADLLLSGQQPVSVRRCCLQLRGGFKRGWKGRDPVLKKDYRPEVSLTKRIQKEQDEIEYYHEYVHKSKQADRLREQMMSLGSDLLKFPSHNASSADSQTAEARALYLSTLQSLVGHQFGNNQHGAEAKSALSKRQEELMQEPTIQRKRHYKEEEASSHKRKRLQYRVENSSRTREVEGPETRLLDFVEPAKQPTVTAVVRVSEETLKEITSQAAAGSLSAQVELGEMYVNGSLPSDPMKAVACFMTGVDERHPPALHNMAKCLARGIGVDVDEKKAFQLWYEACDLGYSVSYYELGYCYLRGIGVPKDEELALDSFKKGGDLGDPRCVYNAGVMIFMGWGHGTSDHKESLRWLKRAASFGLPHAQFLYAMLGMKSGERSLRNPMFPSSEVQDNMDNSTSDLFLDLSGSIKLLRRAALQGHLEAMNHLALAYAQGTPPPKKPLRAMRWWKKAARMGSTTAMCNLVKGHFENHFGESSSIGTGVKLCKKAAKLKNPSAIFMLSGLYRTGVKGYIKKDEQVSVRLLKRSASLGHSMSLYALGKACCKGAGTEIDYKRGFRSYMKAAREGFIPAMFQVSKCYSIGMGVELNDIDSDKWLQRALFHSQKSSKLENRVCLIADLCISVIVFFP